MDIELIENLAKLRLVVGFLGEREQFGWWQSSFFTEGSESFLTPLFGRTRVLAQCNGVTQAAVLIHDERIGVGNVYHLFRLPEGVEQRIHDCLHGMELKGLVGSIEESLDYLGRHATAFDDRAVGPTRVGNKKSLFDQEPWGTVAGLYRHAFELKLQIYPYFADIT